MIALETVYTADLEFFPDEPHYPKTRPKRLRQRAKPALTIGQVLAWADAHFERTGQWPRKDSGEVFEAPGERWSAISVALSKGLRGFPSKAGLSLTRLLIEFRGVGRPRRRPDLSISEILNWADAHRCRTGAWPNPGSGPILEAPGETWRAVDSSLRMGCRGLPGGDSLARLLMEHRGVRNQKRLSPHTIEQILAWADAYYQRTGCWPNEDSGPILDAPGETWSGVNAALAVGIRGLPGGTRLFRLLNQQRPASRQRDLARLSRLTVEQILRWAKSHHERTGTWPQSFSGEVADAPGETWGGVNGSLSRGHRGLPGGVTLPQLLSEHFGKRNHLAQPRLKIEVILDWADAHREATGDWPRRDSGLVDGVPETWQAIDTALKDGCRGLPRGGSLAQLLAEHRQRRNPKRLPPLTEEQILVWADEHFRRTGRWPVKDSGPIWEADGETWSKIDDALISGSRGLPGGSSVSRLLHQHHRKKPYEGRAVVRPLTEEHILGWADEHFRLTGKWPWARSGLVICAAQENWAALDAALALGGRGLPGGSSIAKLLDKHGRKKPHRLRPR